VPRRNKSRLRVYAPELFARGDEIRSKFEAKICKNLTSKGVSYEYERKVIPFVEPEQKRKYVVDFVLANGVHIEAKGLFDADDRKKMLLVREQYPELDIRLLFMRDNRIYKTSKTKYSDWAEKHGFKYHVSSEGEIPDDWHS